MDGHPMALPPVEGDVFALTDQLLEAGFAAARLSPRLRMIQPIHRSQDSRVQRMLNFMLPGTYLRPHLHPMKGATETVQVLRGDLGFIIFDGSGSVEQIFRLSADSGGGLIDIEPDIWHGMAVLDEETVVLEMKRGPYDAERDKIFAEWAPPEGDPECDRFREEWENLFS